MKKGISGHSLVIAISLIVAILGMAILWIFFNNAKTEGLRLSEYLLGGLIGNLPSFVQWVI